MTSVDATIDGGDEALVWVQFETRYVVQGEGQCLAVCGSVPELGGWDINHAAIAGTYIMHFLLLCL